MKKIKQLKQWDTFGHSFQMSYKGQESFQTYLGTLCSLIVAIVMCLHLVEIAFDYASEGRISLNYSQSFFDRIEDETYNLAENGIEIVVLPFFPYPKYSNWKVF